MKVIQNPQICCLDFPLRKTATWRNCFRLCRSYFLLFIFLCKIQGLGDFFHLRNLKVVGGAFDQQLIISSLEIITYHIANLQTLIKSPKVSASCGRYGCIAWILTDFNRFLTTFSCRICSFWGRCSIFWGGGSRGLSELFGRPNVQLPRWRGHHHRSWITH